MNLPHPRVIAVRSGRIRPDRSWLYVWLDTATAEIAHIGGTGFDPELRAYLHLTSDDPTIGRVRATLSRYDERDFDVLAFEVAEGIDRQRAKDALISALLECGDGDERERQTGELRHVVGQIVQAVSEYRSKLTTTRE
ncbi:hypothetical protein [Microbacterium sp. LWH13-1.2]|uniref:hypothetical protein n=1 Tax=Microbacterium sp. LWH13-1.2 TaxID=3135260 RepID=UPI003139AA15